MERGSDQPAFADPAARVHNGQISQRAHGQSQTARGNMAGFETYQA